jgi:hypothetical protein
VIARITDFGLATHRSAIGREYGGYGIEAFVETRAILAV